MAQEQIYRVPKDFPQHSFTPSTEVQQPYRCWACRTDDFPNNEYYDNRAPPTYDAAYMLQSASKDLHAFDTPLDYFYADVYADSEAHAKQQTEHDQPSEHPYTQNEVLGEIIPFAQEALLSRKQFKKKPCRLASLTIHAEPTCDPRHSWLRFEATWLRKVCETTSCSIDNAEPERDRFFLKTSTWTVPDMDSRLAFKLLKEYRPLSINIVFHAPTDPKVDRLATFTLLWAKMQDIQILLEKYRKLNSWLPESDPSEDVYMTFPKTLQLIRIQLKETTPAMMLPPTACERYPNTWSDYNRKQDKRMVKECRRKSDHRRYHTPSLEWNDKHKHARFWEIIVLPFMRHEAIAPRVLSELDWIRTMHGWDGALSFSSEKDERPLWPIYFTWEEGHKPTPLERDAQNAWMFLNVIGQTMTTDEDGEPLDLVTYDPETGFLSSADPGDDFEWFDDVRNRAQRFQRPDDALPAVLASLEYSTEARLLAGHLRAVFAKAPRPLGQQELDGSKSYGDNAFRFSDESRHERMAAAVREWAEAAPGRYEKVVSERKKKKEVGLVCFWS
ncbi:hypothetical protein B0T17DRAFT_653866 [Bombardia bombarda]|uniref:Uncharacterized protein n=1 Tax=Bombardia bombarda TaxID=252184 RepID=A0AA40C9U5_9PEZI|nr:hypothetical protein B0T17DRAFT_653866 [Bombardia bombarda]